MIYNIICGADGPAAAWTDGIAGIRWNWIHFFQLVIMLLLLAPNIIYALKCRGERNLCENRWMNVLEQIGRYGSMFFMIICFGTKGEFGFDAPFDFLLYRVGTVALLTAYWIVWICYFRMLGISFFRREASSVFAAGQKYVKRAVALKWALAILPCCVFLLCAVTLRHVPLLVCAVLFAVGHCFVTRENIIKSIHRKEQDAGEGRHVL